ncbi:MAG: LamG-like jellyroll fold domain-containing protein, partial [Planctomycetota bacterium]
MRGIKMFTILVLCLGLVGNASASLVAHYELAADFNDSSGNGLHGAGIGASIISDPERGDVLSLSGAGQYVDCGNNALFDITEAITVAGWIKVNSFDVAWQSVVAKGNSAWRLSRDGTQDDLEFACTGLSGNWKVLGSINVNDGKWHHVAGVYD